MDPTTETKDQKVFNCAKKLLRKVELKDSKERSSSRTGTCGGEQSSFPLGSPNLSGNSSTFDDLSNFSDSNSNKPEKSSSNSNSKPKLSSSSFFKASTTADVASSSSMVNRRPCKCKSCRTAALTSLGAQGLQVALRCYYCSTGILVSSEGEEEEASKEEPEEEDKVDKVLGPCSSPSPPAPFTCLDCGQHFPSGLPFILRLVAEVSEDIAYWAADWQSKRALADLAVETRGSESSLEAEAANAALECWRKAHLQLGKLLAGDSLRLLQSALKLAEAYRRAVATKAEGSQADVQLLTAAAKTLLGDAYEPLESVLEKEALLAALKSAKKMFEEVGSKAAPLKEASFVSVATTSGALEGAVIAGGNDGPAFGFEVAENEVAKGLQAKIEQLEEVMMMLQMEKQKIEESLSLEK